MAIKATHPRAIDCNIATVEADLALGPAPSVTDAASTAAIRDNEGAMTATHERAVPSREKSWPPSLLRRAWPSMAIAVALIANAIWIGLLGYAVGKLL